MVTYDTEFTMVTYIAMWSIVATLASLNTHLRRDVGRTIVTVTMVTSSANQTQCDVTADKPCPLGPLYTELTPIASD